MTLLGSDPGGVGCHGGGDDYVDSGVSPEALLHRFGLSSFRPGQREALSAALAGRDALVVMPTGGGKSLCYQLPALVPGALVLVVSPLIALMSDQLRRLSDAGVPATMLASGLPDGHNARALRQIAAGEARLVLAAPERFASAAFREALSQRAVTLFVVDEAHCVTEWGHDFRPDYLRLRDAISSLHRPPVMAATATATPTVARDIAIRLGLHRPLSVRAGFDRPNLSFDVVSLAGAGAVARKRAALLHVLADPASRPAIVYCGTRRDTDAVAALISERSLPAVAYHAGMDPSARARSQEAFMSGAASVIVATNAFGMGVDKADVRTVAHWALPTSLEAYYQEAGRAGRDGLPARALLLAARMDLGRLIRFNTQRATTVADVRAFTAALRRRAAPADGVAVIPHDALSDGDRVLLSIAERAGAVELSPGGARGLLARPTGQGSPRLAAAAIRAARDRGWASYRSIERYISGDPRCRRRQILDHFADPTPAAPAFRCCDVCDPDPSLARALTAAPIASARARRGSSPSRRGSSSSSSSSSCSSSSARGEAARAAGAGEEWALREHAPRARANGAVGHVPTVASPASPASPVPVATPDPDPVDGREFERLRRWRYARADGKPAYTVAPNAALEEILRRRPADLVQLRAVHGIGPAFCERHGDSLLAELRALSSAAPAPIATTAPAVTGESRRGDSNPGPPLYESGALAS